MTLSSPHLGYMYNSSKMIDAGRIIQHIYNKEKGLWFLKKWKKSKCLQELTMTDSQNIEETYLYKLTKAKVILFWLTRSN